MSQTQCAPIPSPSVLTTSSSSIQTSIISDVPPRVASLSKISITSDHSLVEFTDLETSIQAQMGDFSVLKDCYKRFCNMEIDEFSMQQKMQEVILEMTTNLDKQRKKLKNLQDKFSAPFLNPNSPILSITTQPAEVSVANRYMIPPPSVTVCTPLNKTNPGSGHQLILSVKLLYHATEKEVMKTIYGEKEILQGIREFTVTQETTKILFNKLKVMEVSSKHKHQAFCLSFELEEYSPQGVKRTLARAKSTPFHVQSRSTKRKRGESDDGSNSSTSSPIRGSDGGQSQSNKRQKTKRGHSQSTIETLSSLINPTLSDSGGDHPNTTTVTSESKDANVMSDPSTESKEQDEQGEGDEGSSGSGVGRKGISESNYIDITHLLSLPQKEAAKHLGISESMLCKRFKECTRRKWPYRYVRKIDKSIGMLKLNRENGVSNVEDFDKLQRLERQRKECLLPVRIRVTVPNLSSLAAVNSHVSSSSSSQTSINNSSNSGSLNLSEEEDIPLAALETLEMLKLGKTNEKFEDMVLSVMEQEEEDEEEDESDMELMVRGEGGNSESGNKSVDIGRSGSVTQTAISRLSPASDPTSSE